MITLDHLALAAALLALAVFGWWGFTGLRMHWRFRRAHALDVSHLALTPPPEVERVIARLRGFERIGATESSRPVLKRPITGWTLVDRERTTLAEAGMLPKGREVVYALATIFRDGTVLLTGHSLGDERRAPGFVLQQTTSSDLEAAWRRHREAIEAMVARHGPAQPVRDMSDALRHSDRIRASLSAHHPRRDLWMLAGWVAGAAIAWGGVAVAVVAHPGPATTDVAAWLAGLRWPVIIGLTVAVLPTLYNLPRFLGHHLPPRT